MIWSLSFMLLVSDSPKTHPLIKQREVDYLVRETRKEISAKKQGGNLKTPWLKILSSKAVWAIFICHFCNNWGNLLYLTQLPSFMKVITSFFFQNTI